jgi:hypothetical protein
MNDILESIQEENLDKDTMSLFYECQRRYLSAAELVGMYDNYIDKLTVVYFVVTIHTKKIVKAIYDRYNESYCDDQILIWEPFEKTVERRWYDFISKIKSAIVENNAFCRYYLRLSGFLEQGDCDTLLAAAIQTVQDIDYRLYLSDEPKREDNED